MVNMVNVLHIVHCLKFFYVAFQKVDLFLLLGSKMGRFVLCF